MDSLDLVYSQFHLCILHFVESICKVDVDLMEKKTITKMNQQTKSNQYKEKHKKCKPEKSILHIIS